MCSLGVGKVFLNLIKIFKNLKKVYTDIFYFYMAENLKVQRQSHSRKDIFISI